MLSEDYVTWSQVSDTSIKNQIADLLGAEIKQAVSIITLWAFVALMIFATVGLPHRVASFTQICMATTHAITHWMSPEGNYYSLAGFIFCSLVLCMVHGWWFNQNHRNLWLSHQSEAHTREQLQKAKAEKAQARATSFAQVITF